MDQATWARLHAAFDEVVDLDPSTRASRLAAIRSGDPRLGNLIDGLLRGDDQVSARLDELEANGDASARESSRGAAPAADALKLVGHSVGRYRIVEALGRGGMGVVYRAEDTRLRRVVALKCLLPNPDLDAQAKSRFIHEARALGALNHPNVCAVYDVGESEEGIPFLAMPLYEGETLRARLARDRSLPTRQVLDIATQLARGLAAAHRAGLVHRDLKPANVMLGADGTVRILDFGLARMRDATLSDAGTLVGTIAYMAPEQLRGERLDARADLFSVGVIVREMCGGHPRSHWTGRASSRGNERTGLDPRHPIDPVFESMGSVIERLLVAEPDLRYQSADELVAALTSIRIAEPSRVGSRRRAAIAAAGLIFAAGAGAVTLSQMDRGNVADAPAAGGADAAGRTFSVAVLPLKSYSSDAAKEYLADGMTDELTSALGKVQALRVIAHQSVVQFKHSAKSIPEIARLLDVQNIVDGSVAQDSNRIWITVALIDARRDTPIWSERFERDRTHVMALQHEVALAIARAIEITLTPGDLERLGPVADVAPAAFEEYLKGTQERNGATYTSQFIEAAEHLERSIALDSTYAPAYAGLALTRALRGEEGPARQLAERALEIDPMQAEAHLVRGMIAEIYDWDWVSAEREIRDAIRLSPALAEAHHELSMLLMRRRRFDEAMREARVTLYLAPMSARFETGVSEILFYRGMYGEALESTARSLAIDPTYEVPYFIQARIYIETKNFAAASHALDMVTSHGRDARADRAYIDAVTGKRAKAERMLDTLISEWEGAKHGLDATAGAHQIASILVGLKRPDEAVEWLEHGVRHSTWMLYVSINPIYEPLHENARFKALLKRVRQD